MDDLYLDTILDRYKHPLYKGWIDVVPTGSKLIVRPAHNVSCGDTFEIALLVEQDVVIDSKWRGEGCAISSASTDFSAEWMVGKKLAQIENMDKAKILSLVGLEEIIPAREKCLLLPLSFIA